MCIRDIHMFDQRMESDYYRKAGTTNQCVYTTLPVVDGCMWSTREKLAGLRVMRRTADGSLAQAQGGTPAVTEKGKGKLLVEWPMDDGRKLTILLSEEGMEIAVPGKVRGKADRRSPKRVRLRIRLYEGHHCDRRHLRGKHIRPVSFRRKDLAEIQITAQRFHKPAACLGIGAGRRCLKPFRECGIPANFR